MAGPSEAVAAARARCRFRLCWDFDPQAPWCGPPRDTLYIWRIDIWNLNIWRDFNRHLVCHISEAVSDPFEREGNRGHD